MAIPKDIESKIKSKVKDECVLDEAEWISAEVEAYEELTKNYNDDEIKESSLGAENYQNQLRFLKEKQVCETLAKAIRTPEHLDLLLDIEHIVGSHCRNKNNKSWKNEYRFRPTFNDGKKDYKPDSTGTCSLIPLDQLLAGKYKFGANELMIFEALTKVIELLESKYGLKFPEKKV